MSDVHQLLRFVCQSWVKTELYTILQHLVGLLVKMGGLQSCSLLNLNIRFIVFIVLLFCWLCSINVNHRGKMCSFGSISPIAQAVYLVKGWENHKANCTKIITASQRMLLDSELFARDRPFSCKCWCAVLMAQALFLILFLLVSVENIQHFKHNAAETQRRANAHRRAALPS